MIHCNIFLLQGEKTLQAVPGAKPAIITASRPITKMIVTQPKGIGPGMQPTTTTKIIPTKIVYGQQGKTQVNTNKKNLGMIDSMTDAITSVCEVCVDRVGKSVFVCWNHP